MTRPLELVQSTTEEVLTNLDEVNQVLAAIGSGVWPLALSHTPRDIRNLLARESLTEEENDRVKAHFLLSRERLLEVIREAGREPHVAGGGALTTHINPHDYWYPSLFVAQAGEDYSRYDTFHINHSTEGVGVDEVTQILSGAQLVIRHRLEDRSEMAVHMSCPGPEQGWLHTHDGKLPHIGSFSRATKGTKVFVQAIGPEEWTMDYLE